MDFVFCAEAGGRCFVHLSLGIVTVALVPNQVDQDLGAGVGFDLTQPVLYAGEGVLASYVVAQEHDVSPPVENACD